MALRNYPTTDGRRRRLRLAALFLLLFLAYHMMGAIVGPALLGWPTARGEERKEFCFLEARRYTACISHGR